MEREIQFVLTFDATRLCGFNLGGWLSQSSLAPDHLETFLKKEDLANIASWGFNHVRLPIDYSLISGERGLDSLAQEFVWVDKAITMCIENGLRCVLDLHLAPGHSFHMRQENDLWHNSKSQQILLRLWQEIADRYRAYPPELLLYDLLNEPTTDNVHIWSTLALRLTETIRAIDLTRPLILESHCKGNPQVFREMSPTGDPYTLYSFHFYDPLVFTHQHAEWTSFIEDYDCEVDYPGQPPAPLHSLPDFVAHEVEISWDRTQLEEIIKPALVFRDQYKVPLYCGEFGVYLAAPQSSRSRWLIDVLDMFKKHEIGWAYWNYKNKGFGVIYDDGPLSLLPEYQNVRHLNESLLSMLKQGR